MIEVDFNEGEAITALFARLRSHLSDLTPVMRQIGEQQRGATRARFLAGQAPDGSVWAPKSPATMAAQAAQGDRPDPRPLIGPSKRLSSEIAYRVGPGGVNVTIGSGEIYAAVQQYGAAKGAFGTGARGHSIPWGNIPARPFLGVSDDDRAAIGRILERWIVRAVANESPG